MKLSEMQKQNKLFIFGDEKAQEIIENCNISSLIRIDYLPKRNENEDDKKQYVFRNSDAVFNSFKRILKRENPHLV